ncbi:MAG: hypothetical protein KAS97_00620, partial [Candidatus Aminicenantes bacterium]|nr:hypothetical protein [Candidatus Aminicenantes bacterium]
NISWKESKRLYGEAWTNLVRNSRAVLGVESGASVFDFTGEIAAKTETITSLLGEKRIEKSKMDHTYYKEHEDKIDLAQISPRIFEAIALRTMCVLYEGNYSGILKPWVHYVPLKKDHSNFDEVVEAIKNDELTAKIITNAYGDIAIDKKYSYNTLIKQFDDELSALFRKRRSETRRKGLRFPDQKSFYDEYPFTQVNNPYGLAIPQLSRFFSFLAPKFPDRLKRYVKKMLNQM